MNQSKIVEQSEKKKCIPWAQVTKLLLYQTNSSKLNSVYNNHNKTENSS